MYKAQNRRAAVQFLLKCGYPLESLACMNDELLDQKFEFHFEAESSKGSKTELERNWGKPGMYCSGS